MKAYKKVNDISKHCQYQLTTQGLHGDMTDLAWKLIEFIRYEVDEDLGKDLSAKWYGIRKLSK